MAMTKCKECGAEISDKAESCPKCGCVLKKKKQVSTSCGCALIMFILFCVMVATCSQMGNGSTESTAPKEAAKPVNPELELYKKRVERCVLGKYIRAYPEKVLKERLVSPNSYVAESTRCDYPKEGEPLKDTLTCVHTFFSKNAFNAELHNSALMKMVLPPNSPTLSTDRCNVEILSIE